MGLQFSITAIGSIMLQSANNALGTACVAAFTAAMRIKMFFLCMLESLGMAMATFCGQNYGAGKPERIWQGVKVAVGLMSVYVVMVNLVLWTCSEEFTQLFVDASETEIITDSALFLHISALFFPFLGVLCILRLFHSGSRLYTVCHVFGRSRNDSPYIGQCDSGPVMGLLGRMLW